jgi:hypothetical protein
MAGRPEVSRREITVELVVALLLVIAAAMLSLEWWRSGELEDLNQRVDELEQLRRRRPRVAPETSSSGAAAAAPKPPPEVRES